MEHYSAIIFLMALSIGMSSLSKKIKIPYPVLLMASGIAVGFIPGFHFIPIDPEVVFLIFLPPILYDAAFNISFQEFRSNINTISMMAITLVFITMAAIAVVARFSIPGMSWPIAFVIGAILSPPDAAAAAGITKSLNLTKRTTTILEGESLINDASALIAFKITVAVAAGTAFVFTDALIDFVISIVGGCLIGIIMAKAGLYIQKKLTLDHTSLMSLNLLLPFVAYMFAEDVGVSGVLAVVILGLIQASKFHRTKEFPERTRLELKSTWGFLTHSLTGLIFILIGLEFPLVLQEVPAKSVIPLIMSSLAIFLVALIIRVIVIFRHKYMIGRILHKAHRDSANPSNNRQTAKRIERVKKMSPLSWKDALVIGWSGMRGIVSLATALALPLLTKSGEAFPHRESILFLTTTTVIFMLLIQGLGLPLLIKMLKIEHDKQDKELSA